MLCFLQVRKHILPWAFCLVPEEILSSVEYLLLRRGISFHDTFSTGLNGDTEPVLLTCIGLLAKGSCDEATLRKPLQCHVLAEGRKARMLLARSASSRLDASPPRAANTPTGRHTSASY